MKEMRLLLVFLFVLASGNAVGQETEEASIDHPVDMTSRIVNPRFENNDIQTGWNGTQFNTWNIVENVEFWNNNYNTFQKIEDLPNGVYAVGAKALYVAGIISEAFNHFKANDEASHYAKLYAESNGRQTKSSICSAFDNNITEPLGCEGEESVTDEETGRTYYIPYSNQAAAERYMHELDCYDNKVLAMVTDGSLTLGVMKEKKNNGDWSVFDDFTLLYYGTGAEAYQAYLDDIHKSNEEFTVPEGTLYTECYLDAIKKHRTASTEEEAIEAFADIQAAYDNLKRNINLWGEWKYTMNRGRAISSLSCFADTEQAKQLAQICGAEAEEKEAARSLTNEQLEAEINETRALIDALYDTGDTQDEYVPFLKEGKTWNYKEYYHNLWDDEQWTKDVSYVIKGTTEIDGETYYKMYRISEGDSTYYCALREEDKKVWMNSSYYGHKLLYDFGMSAGDSYMPSSNQFCYQLTYIEPLLFHNNQKLNVYHYEITEQGNPTEPAIFFASAPIVEGVGCEVGWNIMELYAPIPPNGILNGETFLSCYEDGECIFTADDFNDLKNPKPDIDYRPMFEEGKEWTWSDYDSFNEVDCIYKFRVEGDTIIGGERCYKLSYVYTNMNTGDVISQGLFGFFLEKNKRVYALDRRNNENVWELLYDFNMKKGDVRTKGQSFKQEVIDTDEINVKGEKYRRLTVRNIYADEKDSLCTISYWVEGVGSSRGLMDTYPLNTFYHYYMESCSKDGGRIFTGWDFWPIPPYYKTIHLNNLTWQIESKLMLGPDQDDVYIYSDEVLRETDEIDGIWFQRVYSNAQWSNGQEGYDFKPDFDWIGELNGRIYQKWDDGPYFPIIDFTLKEGDEIVVQGISGSNGDQEAITYKAVAVSDTILESSTDRHLRHCIYVVSARGEKDCWVEGIGSLKYGIIGAKSQYAGSRKRMLKCTLNNKVLYSCPQYPDYRPFIEDGKVWKVGTIPPSIDSPVQIIDYYYFDGDTIIDRKTCKQMMRQRYVNAEYAEANSIPLDYPISYEGAWYEKNKRVYVFNSTYNEFMLKYDFSVNDNDWVYLIDNYPPFIIGPKQTGGMEGFKGVYRDVLTDQNVRSTTWLEGVGGIDGPIRNAYPEDADPIPEFLMSCSVGDEVIYLNDNYEDGASLDAAGARKDRFDFTHTVKVEPKTPRRSQGQEPLYGEYNNLQLDIHLDLLDDAYLVCITDESGKAVYQKAINAGNIVGLNIDISAYAKGRYTVTVENSLETFTGEFEVQTTGVTEVIYNNKVKTNNTIFNLQGQRISSLQKGLNIVNGRKVVIK